MLTYFAYARNASGGIEKTIHESGQYTYYTYDALDRITRDERYNSSNTLLYGFLYNFDAATNRWGAERVRAFLPELGLGASVIDHGGSFGVGSASGSGSFGTMVILGGSGLGSGVGSGAGVLSGFGRGSDCGSVLASAGGGKK